MPEKLKAGQVKLKKPAQYEFYHEQLQQQVSSFHLMIKDMYVKKNESSFQFSVLKSLLYLKLICRKAHFS
jgi:hypothetical protein